jgi:hypothetical protein
MISKKAEMNDLRLFFLRLPRLRAVTHFGVQARPLAWTRNDAQIVIARECLPALYHPRFRAYGRQEITEAISFDFTYERC